MLNQYLCVELHTFYTSEQRDRGLFTSVPKTVFDKGNEIQ